MWLKIRGNYRLFGFSRIDRLRKWLITMFTKRYNLDLEGIGWQVSIKIFHKRSVYREKKLEISNFNQGDSESLLDAWERFKLLLWRCSNHNISIIEQIWHFTRGLKAQVRMLLDALYGGT